ncbi:MAG: hypothetical protein AAGJ79_07670 [Verrucomicrobiota bacterium]
MDTNHDPNRAYQEKLRRIRRKDLLEAGIPTIILSVLILYFMFKRPEEIWVMFLFIASAAAFAIGTFRSHQRQGEYERSLFCRSATFGFAAMFFGCILWMALYDYVASYFGEDFNVKSMLISILLLGQWAQAGFTLWVKRQEDAE